MTSRCCWPSQPAIEISSSRSGSKVGHFVRIAAVRRAIRTLHLAEVKEIEFLDATRESYAIS